MPVPTITALPDAPARSDAPATFIAKADAWAAALPTFGDDLQAVADYTVDFATDLVATNGITTSSTSSVTIGTGLKTFTVGLNLSYIRGAWLTAWDAEAPDENWIYGQVESYNQTTGALVINATIIAGSGTITDWDISVSGAPGAEGPAATGAASVTDMIQVMLELATLRGNQFGTPNGIADNFTDQDGVDLAASSNFYYDAALGEYTNQYLDANTTWTSRSAGATTFNGVATNADGTIAVAVGNAGALYSSTDSGVTWTSRSAGSTVFTCIAFGGGVFVAVGASVCYTSPDGITWTSRTAPPFTVLGITYGAGLFVAVGGLTDCYTSPNGVTWTSRTIPTGTGNYKAVAYNGSNLFVAIGDSGTVASSPDGLTWTSRSFTSSYNALCLTYGGGYWFAGGSSGRTFASSNGTTWTETNTGLSVTFYGAAYTYGKFVLVSGAAGKIYSTPDRVTLTQITPDAGFGSGSYNAIAVSTANFAIVGTSGKVCTAGFSTTALDLRGVAVTALSSPTKGTLYVMAKGASAITPNTHLIGYVSRDNGSTWLAVTLVAQQTVGGYTAFLAQDATLTSISPGTSLRWRFATTSGFKIQLTAVYLGFN